MKNSTLLFLMIFSFVLSVAAQPLSSKQKMMLKNQQSFQRFFQKPVSMSFTEFPFSGNTVNVERLILKSAAQKMRNDSVVTFSYTNTQTWNKKWKDEYRYDANNRLNAMYFYEIDSVKKQWFMDSKTEMTYNAKGLIDKMLEYEKNETDGQMKKTSEMQFFYSATSVLDSVKFKTSNDGTVWNVTSIWHYSYNASGWISEMKTRVYDEDEKEWNEMKQKFLYDAGGRGIEISTTISMEGMEMVYTKTTYTWNANNKLTLEEDWGINYLTFQLSKNGKTEYSYNANGNQSMSVYSGMKETGWQIESKDEYTYTNYNTSDMIDYYSAFYNIYGIGRFTYVDSKMPDESLSYDYVAGVYKLREKDKYYYSNATISGIENVNEVSFNVYPNPANENVSFSWNQKYQTLTLKVYQVSGSTIIDRKISSNEPVSVQKMQKGVYLYRLFDGNQPVQSGKLVVE